LENSPYKSEMKSMEKSLDSISLDNSITAENNDIIIYNNDNNIEINNKYDNKKIENNYKKIENNYKSKKFIKLDFPKKHEINDYV